ncbi:MAG: AAA family ATPase [Chloroflexi bacterium]|nr:AAA family ATPase [Chloroflexota bacterium]
MKLKSVQIENYRAIDELCLQFDPQLTVLHGNNAHGKTSVLSAIAVGLGAVPMLLPDVSGIGLSKKDRRDGRGARVLLTSTEEFSWERTSGLTRSPAWSPSTDSLGERPTHPLRDLKKWLERNALRAWGSPIDLPILAFYDTERAVPNLTRQRGLPKGTSSRYAALAGALSARTSFRELFEWFYSKENEELREQRERRDHDYRLKELSVVRTAISSMIEGVTEPHVELRPLRFVVSERLNGETAAKRTLDQLSGGYQAVLALAADLAWRMAQGNPHCPNPLESEAIGLIDEIELHLHPSWQQRILGDLMRTFPNTQFIVSTHSPQILTTVRPHHIVELHREDNRICARQAADATFGAKAGDVLSTVMGVDERPRANSFVQTLDEYTRLVSGGQGESEEAKTLRRELEELSPRDPALDRADIEIRRRRVMQTAGKSE